MILLQVIIMVYGVVKDAKLFLNEVFKEQMNIYVQQLIHVQSINIDVKVVKHVVYGDVMKLE
jgi:hypothetical protein